LKSSRRSRTVLKCGAAVCLLGAVALRGELAEWVQFVQANSPLESIFFRTVVLPGGAVKSLRPAEGDGCRAFQSFDCRPAAD